MNIQQHKDAVQAHLENVLDMREQELHLSQAGPRFGTAISTACAQYLPVHQAKRAEAEANYAAAIAALEAAQAEATEQANATTH